MDPHKNQRQARPSSSGSRHSIFYSTSGQADSSQNTPHTAMTNSRLSQLSPKSMLNEVRHGRRASKSDGSVNMNLKDNKAKMSLPPLYPTENHNRSASSTRHASQKAQPQELDAKQSLPPKAPPPVLTPLKPVPPVQSDPSSRSYSAPPNCCANGEDTNRAAPASSGQLERVKASKEKMLRKPASTPDVATQKHKKKDKHALKHRGSSILKTVPSSILNFSPNSPGVRIFPKSHNWGTPLNNGVGPPQVTSNHLTSPKGVTEIPSAGVTAPRITAYVDSSLEENLPKLNSFSELAPYMHNYKSGGQESARRSSSTTGSYLLMAGIPLVEEMETSQRRSSSLRSPASSSLSTDGFSSEPYIHAKKNSEKGQEIKISEPDQLMYSKFNENSGEAQYLIKYACMSVADLSFSTFREIGVYLSTSRTLRVINLKSCTVENEGLRGLADISTLDEVCVSHMRQLTSLQPLLYRSGGLLAKFRYVNAQCTSLNNNGIIGLEKLCHLRKLDLSFTPITSVSVLRSSCSLIELNLTGTSVNSDGIHGLEEIGTLNTLNISRTKVCSLIGISKSRSLVDLAAYSCQVDNHGLHGLEKMPNLRILDISTSRVTNMSILGRSKTLKSLTAQWLSLQECGSIITMRRLRQLQGPCTGTADGSGSDTSLSRTSSEERDRSHLEVSYCNLAKIPTLEHVDLSFNAIRSVKSLFSSKTINSLVLRSTLVDNEGIRGIQALQTLRTLVIGNTSDLTLCTTCLDVTQCSQGDGVLTAITRFNLLVLITTLDLSFTGVRDLGLLSTLPCLRELILVQTLVTVDGLRGVGRLPALHTLDISQNCIISLKFLHGKSTTLRKLLVKSNRYLRGFSVGDLRFSSSLESLDISDSVVEDVQMLFHSKSYLKELIWRWDERSGPTGRIDALPCCVNTAQIEGLECMPRLQRVDFTNSDVDSVAFLSSSKSLERLALAGCAQLTDEGIKGLEEIPTLEEIDLNYASGITNVQCLAASPSLRLLKVGRTGVTQEAIEELSANSRIKVVVDELTEAEDAEVPNVEKSSLRPPSQKLTKKSSILTKKSKGNAAADEDELKARVFRRVSFSVVKRI